MKKITAIATASVLLCTSLTGCFFNEKKTYTEYVQAMLDCSYYNIQDKYMELTDATPVEAQQLYDNMVDYVVYAICDYTAVSYDCISDETYYDYQDLAIQVMNKVSYTVETAVKSGSSYHVTVVCEPIDFLENLISPVTEVYSEYIDSFNMFDYSDQDELMNDPEYLALEENYACDVLDVLNNCVNDIGYYAPQSIIVEILDDGDYYSVSDKTWMDIDDLLLGLDDNVSYE